MTLPLTRLPYSHISFVQSSSISTPVPRVPHLRIESPQACIRAADGCLGSRFGCSWPASARCAATLKRTAASPGRPTATGMSRPFPDIWLARCTRDRNPHSGHRAPGRSEAASSADCIALRIGAFAAPNPRYPSRWTTSKQNRPANSRVYSCR